MSALIESVAPKELSKIFHEAHIEMSVRDAKIFDDCQSKSQTTWVGHSDGKLVCAWGIIPPSVLADEVYLWLYTTEAVKETQFLFVRHSQIFIQNLLKEYKAIVGHVKADATGSKRWLRWLGAEISGPPKAGMLTFRIERHG